MKNMLSFSSIFLHKDPVDFRKHVHGLSLIVVNFMKLNFYDNALFAFTNKTKTKIRLLYWDHTGIAMWSKTLEGYTFHWPSFSHDTGLKLSHQELEWLLSGVDIKKIKTHKICPHKKFY